jgi:hypothetical protein
LAVRRKNNAISGASPSRNPGTAKRRSASVFRTPRIARWEIKSPARSAAEPK